MPPLQLAASRRKFEQIFRALNVAHNSKVPINNVNDDILFYIFRSCVINDETPARQILNISHVCRHWRRRSLDFPALWGYMDLKLLHISKLFLERSGHAPINLMNSNKESLFSNRQLSIFGHHEHRLQQMPMVTEILPRLKHLSLFLDGSEAESFLTHVKDSATHLQLHSLDIGISAPTNGEALGWESFQVPSMFFPDDNQMRRLKLQMVSISWHSLPVRQLTQLCIVSPSSSPTLCQLISIISSCPDLELLELEDLHCFDLSVLNITPIHLKRLRRLSYHSSFNRAGSYLHELSRYIRATDLGSINIISTQSRPHAFLLIPEGNERLFEDLVHLEVLQITSRAHFLIRGCTHLNSPSLEQPRTSASGCARGHNVTSDVSFQVSGYVPVLLTDDTEDFTILHQLLQTASNVRRLELVADGWSYLSPSSGVDIATAMPHLSILEMHSEPPYQFVTLDSNVLVSSGIRLDQLVLHHVYHLGPFSNIISQLGLRCLDLKHCPTITLQDVESIRKIGIQVYWSEEMTVRECISRWGIETHKTSH
jgi:hypothetical protein